MFSKYFATLLARGHAKPQLAAIGYILVSTTAFSAMSAGVRLIGDGLDATVIVALRNFLTLMLLAPWLMRAGIAAIRTTRLQDHAWRGLIGGIGMNTWTYALTIMPLTHATALSFTAPLFSTLFAILFLKEKAGTARWVALAVGFVGTLIILRPSTQGFDWQALIVVFATTSWAITGMFVKSLSATEPPMRMVFYMNLFMFLMALPFALPHWQWPDAQGWLVLLVISCASILMHFTMAKAYSLAPVVTLMPFDFTRLITTALFAYLLFGEESDATSWLGAAIIIACAVYMARRDVRAATVE